MKIPKELHVLGQIVTITFKSDEDIGGDCGVSKAFSNSVELNNSLPRDRIGHTFLHELLHQIDDMCKLKLRHKQVDVLAMALYQVLKDNKIDLT